MIFPDCLEDVESFNVEKLEEFEFNVVVPVLEKLLLTVNLASGLIVNEPPGATLTVLATALKIFTVIYTTGCSFN